MSASEWALVLLILALGGTLQGSIGFGAGLFSAPLLILIEPTLIPGPLVGAGVALTASLAIRERASADFHGVKLMSTGALPAIAAGTLIIASLELRWVTILFAALVLLGVGLTATGLRIPMTTMSMLGLGAVSGFMGSITAIGGPPVALMYQHSSGPRIRGTLNAYFFLTGLAIIGMLIALGRYGTEELWTSVGLVPGFVAGVLVSRFTVSWIDSGKARAAVLIVSAVSSVVVLVRTLVGT